MPPRMSTAELDKRNSSILANFTESKDFSMAAPVDQRLRSESLGGEDMTEPIGGPGGAASNFPKTPGVRPNLPPQFLFGGANLSSFSSSSNNNQNSSLIPSFPPPRLLRPENSDVLRKNSNGTNPVIGGLFNQRGLYYEIVRFYFLKLIICKLKPQMKAELC